MSGRQIMGWSLLASPFAAMFAIGCVDLGFLGILSVFIAAAVIVCVVILGVRLAQDG